MDKAEKQDHLPMVNDSWTTEYEYFRTQVCNSLGFDPRILQHGGIWEAANKLSSLEKSTYKFLNNLSL